VADDLVLNFIGVNQVSRVTRDIGRDLGTLEAQASAVGTRISSAWKGTANSLMAIGHMGIMADVTAGAGLSLAIKSVADLNYQMMLLQTHAGFTGNLADLKSGLQALAEETGISATQLAAADYYVSSFGGKYASSAKANLEVITAAAKTAAMTNSDAGETAKALGYMLNAFPGQFRNVEAAAGMLNATVSNGVVSMGDFTQAMHTGLLAVSHDFGQSFPEIGAAFDVLTKGGFSATTASTSLRNIMIQLTAGMPAHVKALASIGLTQQQVSSMMQGPDGLMNVLALIEGRISHLSVSARDKFLHDISGGTRGMAGMDTLLLGFKDFQTIQGKVAAGATTFGDLWAKFLDQTSAKAGQLKQSLITLIQDAITPMVPSINGAMDKIKGVIQGIDDWVKKNPALVSEIATTIGKIMIAIPALSLFLGTVMKVVTILASPLRLILVVLGAAFAATHNHLGTMSGAMTDMQGIANGLQGVFQWLGDIIFNHVVPAISGFFEWLNKSGVLSNFLTGLGKIGSGLVAIFTDSAGGRATLIQDIQNALVAFSSWFSSKGAEDIVSAVQDIINTFSVMYFIITRVVLPPILDVLGFFQDHTTLAAIAVDTLVAAFVVEKVVSFTTAIWDLAKAMYGLTLVQAGVGAVQGIGEGLGIGALASRAGAAIGGLFDMAKIGLQIAGIKLLILGLKGFMRAQEIGSALFDVAKIAAKILIVRGLMLGLKGVRFAVDVVSDIATAASNFASNLAAMGRSAWLTAKTVASAAGSMAMGWGRSILGMVQGVGRIAKAAATFVAEFVIEAASAVAGWVAMAAAAVAEGIAAAAAWMATLGPIALIIAGIAILVGLVVVAITNWNGMGNAAKIALSIILGPIGMVTDAFIELVTHIKEVFGFFRDLAGRIGDAFRGAGSWLFNAGRAIIQGLLDGLLAAWHSVTGFIGGIGNWIHDHKGPISADAVLLYPHGHSLMDGLLRGMVAGYSKVQDFIGGIAPNIAGSVDAKVRFTPALSSTALTAQTKAQVQQQSANDTQLSVLERIAALLQELVACEEKGTQRVGLEAQLQALLRSVTTARSRGIRSVT